MTAVYDWGSTQAERALPLPCDDLLPEADLVAHRAVDVHAPAPVLFRWLCQLRAAPYSYDKLDNLGRRSPQTLTPGLDALEPGQRVMSIFRLASFEPGRSLTLGHRGPIFGPVVCTYAALEGAPVRLLMRIRWQTPRLPLLRHLLAAGDLVMARRQLLNLRDLAEGREPRAEPRASDPSGESVLWDGPG